MKFKCNTINEFDLNWIECSEIMLFVLYFVLIYILVENGNDGTINGDKYFEAMTDHGTFIPYESAQPIADSMLPQTYNNFYNDPANAPNSEFVCFFLCLFFLVCLSFFFVCMSHVQNSFLQAKKRLHFCLFFGLFYRVHSFVCLFSFDIRNKQRIDYLVKSIVVRV